jgi:serine phosphatase RsbU (regulator of sigma subunit)
MKRTEKKKRGMSVQLIQIIIVGILIAGIFTYILQYTASVRNVRDEIRMQASATAMDMISALREYPAYEWLLSYWYENAERLDVEYDIGFEGGTATDEKEKLFNERHPDLLMRGLSEEEIQALSDEDQQLFAEVAYSRLLSRINEIKRSLGCDYLYLSATGTDASDQPYKKQCFLMSGADPGAVRGTNYGEVYMLGVTTPIAQKDSAESMRKAVKELEVQQEPRKVTGESLTGAGNYDDFYECVAIIGDKGYLAGVTYDVKDVLSHIRIDALKSTLLAAVCQFVLLIIVMRWVSQYMISPLKKILRSIRNYTDTRDSVTVEKEMTAVLSGKKAVAVRENEVGQLAEDFTALVNEIDTYVEEIRTVTSQKEKYRTELSIASQIQEQVLPKDFTCASGKNEFDLYATMVPAREVGGDFYDFFFTDQDHLALVIGDVSDKGIPAALFMMITKTLISYLAKIGESPAQIMTQANEQLCENNESGYFVTVWFALIDLTTGEGIAVNAGHEYPAVCRAGGSYELIHDKHSMAVGTLPGIKFREHAFHMNPGDQLFVYTDGVPEAINKDNEQFGTDRMLEVLNQNKDTAPEVLLARMKEAIDAFAGEVPQFDDTTMLCFHYKGDE